MNPLKALSKSILYQIEETENKRIPSLIGYIYFLLANLCYSFLNMNVGRLSTVPPYQLFYLRNLWPTMMFYFILRANKQPRFTKSIRLNKLVIFNGLLYAIAGPSYFYGFQVVPLNEATVIFQTNPAISGILAVFFLGEAYDAIQLSITLFCTIGVILIAKPAFLFGSYVGDENINNPERAQGILSLLLGSFAIGSMSIVIKKIVTLIDSNFSAFYIGLIPSIVMPFLMLQNPPKNLDFDEIVLIIQIIIFGFLAQVFYNRAFKFGDASKISLMAYSQILFSTVLDIYVIGTVPDKYSLIGATFIFCCMFLRMYQTWIIESKKPLANVMAKLTDN